MVIVGQVLVIGALFVVVFVLHRKARRMNFERFRARHARRKYRIVLEPASESPPPNPDEP